METVPLLITLIGIVALIVFVVALVSIIKHPTATIAGKVVWILVSLILPFVGPLLWFAWGRSILRKNPPSAGPRPLL